MGRALVTPTRNRRMLRIKWDETMTQAESCRTFQARSVDEQWTFSIR
jgi:hypothetical protein